MNETPSPHDAFFKRVAADPAVAADIIRPLLDPAVAAAIDWDSLEPYPAEFTDDDGNTTRADIVYRARFHGQEGFVLILLEHQSTPDPMMPWRALVYMVGIWRRWRETNKGANHLPPIVPVVIYNGRHPWGAPVDFSALFSEVPPAIIDALRPHLLDFRLLVDDLARADDEQIEASHQLALALVALLALKHGHGEQPDETFIRLARHIPAARSVPENAALLDMMMRYLYRKEEKTPDLDAVLPRVGPDAAEFVMGFIQRLEEKGREEGRAEGREEGRAEGREEGRAEGREEGREEGRDEAETSLLVTVLRSKFGAVPNEIVERIQQATSPQRRQWTTEVFAARSLEELFPG